MPIRVRIERVGYYQQYPDKVIVDLTIERTDEVYGALRRYKLSNGNTIWHRKGKGVLALVKKALKNVEV